MGIETLGWAERGRDVSSPGIRATKISALFGDNNVAQMSRRLNGQICSHTPSALNAGAKRSGATCRMAMPQCCYLAKGAKRPSHTTIMLTSSNISVNWSIRSTHLVDTFVAHVTDAILSPKCLVTKCPWPGGSRSKERDRKSELVLRSTYQIFEWDRNNSDRNIYNVVRYVHIPLVPWMQERSGATCHMAMPHCCY